MTLDQLKPNQQATVVRVTGERLQRLKFLDMGLTTHTRLHVAKIAPMGDPIEVGLRGYFLTLRRDEAACIEVKDVCDAN